MPRASLDGCGVFRGGEHTFSANHSWLHVDQNLRNLDDLNASVQVRRASQGEGD